MVSESYTDSFKASIFYQWLPISLLHKRSPLRFSTILITQYKVWFRHFSMPMITPLGNVLWLLHYLPEISLALLVKHYCRQSSSHIMLCRSVTITRLCYGCSNIKWNVISRKILYIGTPLPMFEMILRNDFLEVCPRLFFYHSMRSLISSE